MTSDVEKLMKKTEKLSVDSPYDTNWCDMPPEVKSRCIGKMEFKERLSLRCTAKAERSLVDSAKIEFQDGSFLGDPVDGHFSPWTHPFQIRLYSKNGNKIEFKGLEEHFELVKFIWKVGIFENVAVSISGTNNFKNELIDYSGKISVKNIEFGICNSEISVAVLKKTKNMLQSIALAAEWNPDYPIDEVFAIPQVRNAKYCQIIQYEEADALYKVAQVWIDKNPEIGTTFQLSTMVGRSYNEFLEHFMEHIITISEERIRIRTDNPDRHILLERGIHPTDKVLLVPPYLFRLLVIPADMKESEYDRDCLAWILKIDPDFRIDRIVF
ncbi:unnamed protein product [Caenorhabditis nigoni]